MTDGRHRIGARHLAGYVVLQQCQREGRGESSLLRSSRAGGLPEAGEIGAFLDCLCRNLGVQPRRKRSGRFPGRGGRRTPPPARSCRGRPPGDRVWSGPVFEAVPPGPARWQPARRTPGSGSWVMLSRRSYRSAANAAPAAARRTEISGSTVRASSDAGSARSGRLRQRSTTAARTSGELLRANGGSRPGSPDG